MISNKQLTVLGLICNFDGSMMIFMDDVWPIGCVTVTVECVQLFQAGQASYHWTRVTWSRSSAGMVPLAVLEAPLPVPMMKTITIQMEACD